MNTIYLVRHGENVANITKEFSHRLVDYSLTPKGVLQAEQTAAYFRDRHIDEIYSSPLKRALETAEIIAREKGLHVNVVENFREVNVGSLEGHATDENWRLYARIVRDWFGGKPEAAFPGGEDLHMLQARTREALEKIVAAKEGRKIIIVGHGGVFTGAVTGLCRHLDIEMLKGEFHNCAISEIEISSRSGTINGELKGWGFCSHLSGEAAEMVSALPKSAVQD